jgi:hypothetical protein
MAPSSIPLVGLATRPANALWPLHFGPFDQGLMGQAGHYQVVFMWVVIEFEGGPSGQDLIRGMPISCEAHRPLENSRFRKLDGCIAVSGSIEI